MDQTKLKETIKNFLDNHRKMVLATVGLDEHPTSSLMLYAVDDKLNIYFGTRKSFNKYSAISKHPYVSLSVIEEGIDPLRVVEIRGKVEAVAQELVPTILKFFEAKNASKYYVKGAEDFVMFTIKPNFVRWLDATSGSLNIEHLEA
jgi:general stress protein 26